MEEKSCIKIALVGPESTGKSWLSEELAKYYHTIFVPEYARLFFETNSIESYTINDLDHIYEMQLRSENRLMLDANRLLFCDTTPLSGKIWSEIVFGKTSEFILNAIHENKYDLFLLCDVDVPWVEDDQRKNEADRAQIFEMHLHELKSVNAEYIVIKGSWNERVQQSINVIDSYLKSIA
jgi:NadR type nicotinamide-nucleotide adenylyltransferase